MSPCTYTVSDDGFDINNTHEDRIQHLQLQQHMVGCKIHGYYHWMVPNKDAVLSGHISLALTIN